LDRANEVLAKLEASHAGQTTEKSNGTTNKKIPVNVDDFQLSFFQLDDPVLENIKEELINIDINTLTPVEALMKLNEIKKMVGG
ncbi:MAG TPA: hypothetical protein PK649_04805, partial [Vicingus sp.]|nr:hypothetical protein [Vicingus sp.]